MNNIPQQLYGIIGYPLGHSQSPRVHNAAFTAAGLSKVYMAWPTPPEKLAALIDAVRTLPIAGLSVTIPHKERIIPLLDAITPAAHQVGAVNTVFWKDGALCGHNTDMAGFMAPLQGKKLCSALVLGAGGAARAVLAGLQTLGYTSILTNHHLPKAMALAHEFQIEYVPWEKRTHVQVDILINATPLGMQGDGQDKSPYPAAAFAPNGGLAYDLVYTPLHTRFLREAHAAGWDIQDGLDMFAAQAAEQFHLWTGESLDPKTVRATLEKA
ncbi:MAG: shikimate dehydrogenase [Desulfovibrionaceae bacterium]